MIKLFIQGIPKAQPRTKATHQNGYTRVYTPGTAKGWKDTVSIALLEWHGLKLSGPVKLDIIFLMPRPKRLLRKKDTVDRIAHTCKPDTDNLTKAVMDAITDCGVWVDDCQVFDQHSYKYYAGKNEETGIYLTIKEME
jgi:crossover junction endodeoxyribonuclease RusA